MVRPKVGDGVSGANRADAIGRTSDQQPDFQLRGARVLIAGGTSGVGLATSRAFARAGAAHVVVGGRNPDRGEAAAKAVAAEATATSTFVAADVNTADGATGLVTSATERMGGLDIVVNSTVAPYMPVPLHNMPIEDLHSVLAQQALGTMLVCRAAIDVMRPEQSGAIVNIASDAQRVPTPGETGIGAAMAAIVTFSQTLALEAKRYGVRVNVLTPSMIVDTGSHERAMATEFSKKIFDRIAAQAHLGLTEPEDLSNAILFLASPLARRVTGQVISVNGGISIAS
ncbi:SDR family NAD(P)-dependent oxidoreductase [Saccharopolyspora pogona]|uniref:SDR family NAD(P)-dependent oxidoreductase n=1 Tax=Saccharopolyspora pogona TaxID=333966 RepID=UPI001688B404|nr:SDR family oxidoreductase [Saccharopolyspora pogona]